MPMPHQTDTIIWIPISEKLPPSELVMASTKNSVHILQYHRGKEKGDAQQIFGWTGERSRTSDLKTLLLGQSCLGPFFVSADRSKPAGPMARSVSGSKG
jgi:hypothetical protein